MIQQATRTYCILTSPAYFHPCLICRYTVSHILHTAMQCSARPASVSLEAIIYYQYSRSTCRCSEIHFAACNMVHSSTAITRQDCSLGPCIHVETMNSSTPLAWRQYASCLFLPVGIFGTFAKAMQSPTGSAKACRAASGCLLYPLLVGLLCTASACMPSSAHS